MSQINEGPTLSTPLSPPVAQTSPARNFSNPDDPPWGIFAALLVWLFSVGLIVVLPQLFLFPYLLSKGFRLTTPEEINALVQFSITDKTAVLLQVVALLPSHLLTLLMVWALVTRFGKRRFWATLGWSWTPRFGFWWCVAAGVALFVIAFAVSKMLGGGNPTTIDQVINSSLAARYLLSFLAVATAPFAEEFVYRAVLYAPLQRALGIPAAVVIVLVLFTAIHIPQYRSNIGVIAAVGLLSVALTLIRAYARQLLPCVVIHLVFNGIQAVLLVLEPYIQRFVPTPEPISPPASLLAPLIGLLT